MSRDQNMHRIVDRRQQRSGRGPSRREEHAIVVIR
jgi:hypothetical protein